MEQGYLSSLSKIGIKFDDNRKIDYLRNRVLVYISMKQLEFSLNEIYDYCSQIGFDVNLIGEYKKQYLRTCGQ